MSNLIGKHKMRSAITPEDKGVWCTTYRAKSGRKAFEQRRARIKNNRAELYDSKGLVLVREDCGGHERAKRIGKEWVGYPREVENEV